MRLSDLRDKKITTVSGETIGRVHEVHCERGRITALMCGTGGLIERWTAKREGTRIAWECVQKVQAKEIVVDLTAGKNATGSRTRRRTPRASGPQSKR